LYTIPDVNIPLYWIRPQQLLSAQAGPHRFLWDLHCQPLNVPAAYPISAVYANTSPGATSPWVMPGVYTVKLTVNGKTYAQPVTVRMDPRVKTPLPALQQQHALAEEAYKGRQQTMMALERIHSLRARILASLSKASGQQSTALQQLDARAAALEGSPRRGGGRGGPAPADNGPRSFSQLQNDYATVFTILEEADLAPTIQAQTALQATARAAMVTEAAWTKLQQDATTLNITL
jgi:hypothetical protein